MRVEAVLAAARCLFGTCEGESTSLSASDIVSSCPRSVECVVLRLAVVKRRNTQLEV